MYSRSTIYFTALRGMWWVNPHCRHLCRAWIFHVFVYKPVRFLSPTYFEVYSCFQPLLHNHIVEYQKSHLHYPFSVTHLRVGGVSVPYTPSAFGHHFSFYFSFYVIRFFNFHMQVRKMGLCAWLISLNTVSSSSVHIALANRISFFLVAR